MMSTLWADAHAVAALPALPSSPCPRCGRQAKTNPTHPICTACQTALRQQAMRDQERDYLAAWLSSRADASGRPVADSVLVAYPAQVRQVARLVRRARIRHLDWIHPPEGRTFDSRMSVLMKPLPEGAGKRRGRPAGRVAALSAKREGATS